MKLYGLQKMTLLDFPGRVACTVFTGGCDLRCPFCHNYSLAEGTAPAVMDEEEFFAFLKTRKNLLEGVAITGGEPCLQKDLFDFISQIKDSGFSVKLDTNGLHPERLEKILKANLVDYVAMDIKNSPEKYAATCGVKKVDTDKIKESVSLIKNFAPDYEFRTTAVKPLHTPEDFVGVGKLIEGAKNYFIQSFTDRDSVPFGGFSAPDGDELNKCLEAVSPYVAKASLRGNS